MTANELIKKLNQTHGLSKWPNSLEVDAETYANVCNYIFIGGERVELDIYDHVSEIGIIQIAIGPNSGIMFKNVELILK